jgi:protein TonB
MPHAAFEPDDPDLAIPHEALETGYRDLAERLFRAKHDGLITHKPVEPLAPRPAKTLDLQRKWKLALLLSLVIHAALALFFFQANDEAVQMEGAEYSGAAEAGNADADAISAGAVAQFDEMVEVTMITMLEARPVETIEAESVPVETATEAVETAEPVAAETETLQPVEETVTTPDNPATVAAEPAERQRADVADTQVAATTNETVPEVLATDQPLPPDENNVVQKALETQATVAAETSETIAAEPIDEARPTATEVGESVKAASSNAEPVEPMPAAKVEPIETKQVEHAEATQKKPAKKKAAAATEKPTPKKAEQGKKATATSANKPKSAAGSGGKNQADAKRGQNSSGQSASTGGGGKSSAAGNAAVSNYPGKVAAKLRRALRYPAEAKRQKLRGVAQVSFVVSASGGVGSIRLAASSGSPVLDKAALEAVRRAAPFPAIPTNAGRSSWRFSVPLAFNR